MGKTIENMSCMQKTGRDQLRCDCPSDWPPGSVGEAWCGCPGQCYGWQKFYCDDESTEDWILDSEGYDCRDAGDMREEFWSEETEDGVEYAWYTLHGETCRDDASCESWYDDQTWQTPADVPYYCSSDKCYAWRKYECVESSGDGFGWELVEEGHDCGPLAGARAEGWTMDSDNYAYYTVYGASCTVPLDCESWAGGVDWPEGPEYECPIKRCLHTREYRCNTLTGMWYVHSTTVVGCLREDQYSVFVGWRSQFLPGRVTYGIVLGDCVSIYDCSDVPPEADWPLPSEVPPEYECEITPIYAKYRVCATGSVPKFDLSSISCTPCSEWPPGGGAPSVCVAGTGTFVNTSGFPARLIAHTGCSVDDFIRVNGIDYDPVQCFIQSYSAGYEFPASVLTPTYPVNGFAEIDIMDNCPVEAGASGILKFVPEDIILEKADSEVIKLGDFCWYRVEDVLTPGDPIPVGTPEYTTCSNCVSGEFLECNDCFPSLKRQYTVQIANTIDELSCFDLVTGHTAAVVTHVSGCTWTGEVWTNPGINKCGDIALTWNSGTGRWNLTIQRAFSTVFLTYVMSANPCQVTGSATAFQGGTLTTCVVS